MATLFIHIGAHKTGTTALQGAFASHASRLKAQGVLYPRTNWFHFAQHRLAFALKGIKDPTKRDMPDFLAEVSALNTVITSSRESKIFISSEEFFSCPPEKISALADALQVEHVRILATVRRPDELVLSIYNQNVKQPGNKFIRRIVPFVTAPRILNKDVSQYDCVRNWCDVFGVENMSLMQYEAGSTIDQVCECLGVSSEFLEADARQSNPSVPGATVEIMRLSKANGFPPEKQTKLFTACQKAFPDGPKTYLSNQDRRTILSEFESENDLLFAMFGQENPYKAKIIPDHETEDFRQNATFREFIRVLDQLID